MQSSITRDIRYHLLSYHCERYYTIKTWVRPMFYHISFNFYTTAQILRSYNVIAQSSSSVCRQNGRFRAITQVDGSFLILNKMILG